MTDKAYIVANEQQECEVLRELEEQGYTWNDKSKATSFIHSEKACVTFLYAITSDRFIGWLSIDDAVQNNYEIAFDGRKEEKMSDKYVVSQEFMEELEEWKKRGNAETYFVGSCDISMLPDDIKRWWNHPEINNFECNNRLIAIIRWVSGEDVFEVEKPKKWVVRSKETDSNGAYGYAHIFENLIANNSYYKDTATRFDTQEEAQEWCNSHQEPIEVKE